MGVLQNISNAITSAINSLGVWGDVIINLFGVIAIVSVLVSYQMKERDKIFILYIVATFSWIIYFILQGNLVSGIMCVISVCRSLVFMQRGKKKWAESAWWLVVFFVLMVGATIFTYRDWRDIFALLATALGTIAFFMVKEKHIRYVNVVAYVFWILNSVTNLYVVSTISDVATLISLLIAIYRFRKTERS